VTHYWVNTWIFKKNSKKFKKKFKKKPRSDTWHAHGLTRVYPKKILKKFKKYLKINK